MLVLNNQDELLTCFSQAIGTFEAALKRLKDAGVELVKFDMGLLSAEGAEVEAELLLAYEAPREIARWVAKLCCIVSSLRCNYLLQLFIMSVGTPAVYPEHSITNAYA